MHLQLVDMPACIVIVLLKSSCVLHVLQAAWTATCMCILSPQVENGDLNWIVPGKLVAFSGPAARPTDYVGFRAMVPEDYWDYWHKRGVQAVVRLNKKVRLNVARWDGFRKRFGFGHGLRMATKQSSKQAAQ
jgi:hypothetical protein